MRRPGAPGVRPRPCLHACAPLSPGLQGGAGDPADLLKPERVARQLGVSPKALERWRSSGTEPAVVRINHKTLRYRVEAVEAFIVSRPRTSTADE